MFLCRAEMFYLSNVEGVISSRMYVNHRAGDICYGSLDEGIALVPDIRNPQPFLRPPCKMPGEFFLILREDTYRVVSALDEEAVHMIVPLNRGQDQRRFEGD